MGNNDFKIILQALLDETSLSDIEKKLAKKKINLGLDFDFAKSLNESEKQVKELSKRFKEIFNFKTDSEALSFTKKYLTESNKLIAQNEKLQEKSNAEMQKALEKTEQLRKEEEQRQAKAQNDAINKNLEKEYQEREKLTEAMARGREQSELARQAEEKRQQKVQNNAINKSLTDEYNLREKNRVAAEKQNQIDLERASSFTKANSQKIKDAMSKYSYGYSSDAKALMQELNRGMSNFKIDSNGNISNVSDTIAQYETRIKSVLESLQQTHKTNLSALNSEISEETKLQSQKDAFNQKNLNAIDLEIQKREEASRRFSDSIKAQMTEEQNLLDKVSAINKAVANGQVSKDLNGKSGVSTLYNSLNTETTSTVIPESLKADYQNLITLSEKLNTSMSDTQKVETWKKYQSTLESVKNHISTVSTTTKQLASQTEVSNTIANLNDQLRKNSAYAKSAKTEIKGFITELSKGNVASERLGEITTRARVLHSEMGSLNKIGFSLGDRIKNAASKFTMWTSSTMIIMKVFQEIKRGISFISELDDVLSNINYTMNVTKKQLTEIGNSSIDMAKELNTSATNVLSAVKLYANANETAQTILNKARPAVMLSNVTGNTAEQEAKNLQAIQNQFQLTDDELIDLSDTLEKISGSMSYDFADGITQMSEAIQTSGAAAKAAGMNYKEYMALIGAGVENTGLAGTQLANAYKTMMARTTSASKASIVNGEVSEEDISNAEKSLRNVGIEVRKDNDSFRDFDKTMGDIYEKLDTLSDVDLSKIAYDVAGVRQTSVFRSMIESYDDYLNLVKQADTASGTTLETQDKYAESVKGRLGDLEATAQSFWNNLINSDVIKSAVGLLDGVLSTVDKLTSALGGLGTIAAGAASVGIVAFIKNLA